LSNAFFDFVGRKKKQTAKVKLEKESGAQRPSASAYLKSLKTTRCGYKAAKSTSLIESNENREKLKICKAKHYFQI